MKFIRLITLVILTPILLLMGCDDPHAGRQRSLAFSAKIAKIDLYPNNPVMRVSSSQQFVAVVKDSSDRQIDNVLITWSSDNPAVAVIDPVSGMASAISVGIAHITASTTTMQSEPLRLEAVEPVSAIEVFPASSTIEIGSTQWFTAIAKDENGNLVSGIRFAWASDSPEIASVDSEGLVTGLSVSQGPVKITVSGGGVIGSADLNVKEAGTGSSSIVAAIEVFPKNVTFGVCTEIRFVAIASDSEGNQVSNVSFVWASDMPSLLSINPDNGLARGLNETIGAAVNITATAITGGIAGGTDVQVINNIKSIEISPAASEIKARGNQQFASIVSDLDGIMIDEVFLNWVTDNQSIAVIDQNGKATGVGPGSANISASCGGKVSNEAVLSVSRRTPIFKWKTTASMETGLYDHASAITSGLIYTIGGVAFEGFQGKVFFSEITEDGSLGPWNPAAVLPLDKMIRGHAVTVSNDSIYVLGGIESGIPEQSQITIFSDVVTATSDIGIPIENWRENQQLPVGLFAHTAQFINGYIYVIGGWEGTQNSDSVYFAPVLDNKNLSLWRETSSLPNGVSKHTSVSDGRYIYVIGGTTGSIDEPEQARMNVFFSSINSDGSLNGWSETTPLPMGLEDHASVMKEGYVFVFGGWNGWDTAAINNIVLYAPINADGSLGGWEEAASMPKGLIHHSVSEYNDFVYIVGGESCEGNSGQNLCEQSGLDGQSSQRQKFVYFTSFTDSP